MIRWYIQLIIILCLVQVASATMCDDILEPGENCTMLTPSITCTNYTYNLYNNTNIIIENGSLTQLQDDIYYFTFNQSEGDYIVKLCDDSTREIKVEREGIMVGLGLVLFVLVVNIGIFLLPLFKTFSKNEILNLIMKRGCYVIGLFLMMLNSTIIVTIAEYENLDVSRSIYQVYTWGFGMAGYLMILLLVLGTIFQTLKMWRIKKGIERYGYE